jgi:hypothetical protein
VSPRVATNVHAFATAIHARGLGVVGASTVSVAAPRPPFAILYFLEGAHLTGISVLTTERDL